MLCFPVTNSSTKKAEQYLSCNMYFDIPTRVERTPDYGAGLQRGKGIFSGGGHSAVYTGLSVQSAERTC